jgi:hypothetical protein
MDRASIRYDGRRDMAWVARDDDSLDDDVVVDDDVGVVDDDEEEKARNEVEVPPLVFDDEAA